MVNKPSVPISVIVVLLIASVPTLNGCISDPVSTTIAAFTARSVVNNAFEQANQLLDNAKIDANAVTARNAAELQFAAQNAELLLFDQLDQRIDRLSTERRDVVYGLQDFTNQLKTFQPTVNTFRSNLSIDMYQWLNKVPLVKNTDFLVEQVDGTVYTRGSGEIQITIAGIGVADQSDDRSASISEVELNHRGAVPFYQQRIDDHTCRLVLPESALNHLNISPDQFSFVSLSFKSLLHKTSIWGATEKSFTFETTLTVVPENVGTGEIVCETPKYDWVRSDNDFTGAPFTTPSWDYPPAHYPQTVTITAPATKRIEPGTVRWETSFNGVAGQCPWTTLDPSELPRPTVTYSDGSQRGTLVFLAWGKSIVVTLHCALQEYKQVGINSTIVPIVLTRSSPVRAVVPTACQWTLHAKTITGRPISIGKGEQPAGVSVHEEVNGPNDYLSFSFTDIR